jgi:hypothetical protein
MTATGAAEIRAAAEGREALEGYLASHEFDMEQFTPADQAALQGDWAWLARIAGLAMKGDGRWVGDRTATSMTNWATSARGASSPGR